MNDIIGILFALAAICFMIAFGVYYQKFTEARDKPVSCPVSSCPVSSCPVASTRLGISYKPSSNTAPNNILSKVNGFLDDMKPMLCTTSGMVNEEFEKAQEEDSTCTQIKERLAAEFSTVEDMAFMSDDMKKSLLDLNHAIIDSVCGSDDKMDVAKAKIVGSDIKGMFC
jgi:hypothetical protein